MDRLIEKPQSHPGLVAEPRRRQYSIALLTPESIQARALAESIGSTLNCQCSVLPPDSGAEVALRWMRPVAVLVDLLAFDGSDLSKAMPSCLDPKKVSVVYLNAPVCWGDAMGGNVETLPPGSPINGVADALRGVIPGLADGQGKSSREALESLTRAELRILQRLRNGLSNKVIADQLCCSGHTVKTHLYNIYPKIGCRNRAQAALWARQSLGDHVEVA